VEGGRIEAHCERQAAGGGMTRVKPEASRAGETAQAKTMARPARPCFIRSGEAHCWARQRRWPRWIPR